MNSKSITIIIIMNVNEVNDRNACEFTVINGDTFNPELRACFVSRSRADALLMIQKFT